MYSNVPLPLREAVFYKHVILHKEQKMLSIKLSRDAIAFIYLESLPPLNSKQTEELGYVLNLYICMPYYSYHYSIGVVCLEYT